MLKADKHLHPNEKLIRLKRNKPFFLGAALMFCDSKVNQSILHLLIKNLIQSRYKMLYRGKKKGGGSRKLQLSFSIKVLSCFFWEISQLLDRVFNVPQHFETEGYALWGKKNTFECKTGNLSCTECFFLLLLKIISAFYY